jgi:hypothetical protein
MYIYFSWILIFLLKKFILISTKFDTSNFTNFKSEFSKVQICTGIALRNSKDVPSLRALIK